MILQEHPIDPDQLIVAATDILGLMHRQNEHPDAHTLRVVESAIEESRKHCVPRGASILKDAIPSEAHEEILIGEGPFCTGRIISERMEGAVVYAFFLATSGPGPEELARSLILGGQYLEGYVADLVASALAEAVVEQVHERIREEGARRGFTCTNRYSPGYCGWDVAEQQKLFALFPEGFCGIRLTPSSLMSPIKSISGVIGLGPSVTFREYNCELCGIRDCLYRRSRN